MKKLIFMRGASGSGKSTLAHQIAVENTPSVILSTDELWHVWLQVNKGYIGHEYLWNPSALAAAHQVNQAKAKVAMERDIDFIIIDNTNTTYGELEPYLKCVDHTKYEVVLLEPSTEWKLNPDELGKKNTHNVPWDVIKKQLNRYQSNALCYNQIRKNFPDIKMSKTL